MNEETIDRINKMKDNPPIENPCLYMESLGYRYEYRKGLIDKTPYYTRVEEDSIVYIGKKYIIKFNLASESVVISMIENNAEYYGGHPTMFLDNVTLECINIIRKKLGWHKHVILQ